MDTFDRQQLRELLASEGGPHLTVFLPTPERPIEAKTDAIRISNFARDAIAKLKANWMPEQEGEDFVKPLRALAEDETFLGDRPHGMVVYLSENLFKIYPLEKSPGELLLVDRAFHVRPLLAALEGQLRYFVLRLSKKGVTLVSASPGEVTEVALEDLPESFEDRLASVWADRGSQTHSAANASGAVGKQAAVFHGQGGLPDAEKTEMTEYLRKVDTAVCKALADQEECLVLAGVDYETAIYRNISSYPRIAAGTVSGNMDHLTVTDLAERARPFAASAVGQEREEEAERIRERRHQPVATDAEQVLNAASKGQVKTLFIDQNASLWGSYYQDTQTMREMRQPPSGEPGDACHDLIELAAAQTLKHGGRVYSVTTTEMPVDAKMAAALRY